MSHTPIFDAVRLYTCNAIVYHLVLYDTFLNKIERYTYEFALFEDEVTQVTLAGSGEARVSLAGIAIWGTESEATQAIGNASKSGNQITGHYQDGLKINVELEPDFNRVASIRVSQQL